MNSRRPILLAALALGLLFLLALIWLRATRAPTPLASVPAASAPAAGSAVAPAAEKTRAVAIVDPSVLIPAGLRAGLQSLLAGGDVRPHEALLTFKDAASYQRFLARAQHRGLTVLGQLDALLAVRVRYDSLDALAADLTDHTADYADIAPNALVHIPQPPAKVDRSTLNQVPFRNDTLAFLGAAADRTAWGRGTMIAILDTGVAPDSTFGGDRVHYLNVGLGTLPATGPEGGHGTSVASLAAGSSSDAPGVAPGASVLSIRVTDGNGVSDLFTVARAILAAVDAGAPIVNLSLGGYATTATLDAAIDYARTHGTVLVAAAGNDQAAQLAWPAADPRVVSVGAVDALGQQVAFSNSGPQLQLAAPGYGVQTAWLDGERVYVDGTSASAPLVAGAIAAVMSQNPSFSADHAWEVVRKTASDAGAPGADPDYGNGVLNLDWAMNAANPTRADPAVSSHYYDASRQEMDFVVQNRGAQTVTGLNLDLDLNGTTTTYRVPAIAPGASYVLKVPVDQKALVASQGLTFTTQLVTPFGLEDANVANNRLRSRLPPPTK